jgi:hypothetical protein
MAKRIPPIARVRLARSAGRILALPALMVIVGAAAAGVTALGPVTVEPIIRALVVAAGAVLVGWGILIGLRPMTAGLDVEEAAVRLHWLGGERIYVLTPGPVTRVRLRGADASKLRSRSGGFGWILGAARLRDEEDIEAIRLAPTESAILIPTERGRLAIAPRAQDELLDALSRAARARQRLEELATPTPIEPTEPAPRTDAQLVEQATVEPEPHVLTGIERAELEDRLGRQQVEARLRAAAGPHAPPVEAVPSAAEAPAAEPTRRRWRGGRPGGVTLGRPRPSVAFVLLPLLGAGVVWGAASTFGRLPEAGTDLGRLTSLALVLAGPATSIGAIMARAWWPRIVGVVVTSGLVAAVFVGRSLLGS